MGIFGAGNSGAAVNKFIAPAIIASAGWIMVPKGLCCFDAGSGFDLLVFSATDPSHNVKSSVSFGAQLKMLKDPKAWRYCQYHSVVFGGYVGPVCGW